MVIAVVLIVSPLIFHAVVLFETLFHMPIIHCLHQAIGQRQVGRYKGIFLVRIEVGALKASASCFRICFIV